MRIKVIYKRNAWVAHYFWFDAHNTYQNEGEPWEGKVETSIIHLECSDFLFKNMGPG